VIKGSIWASDRRIFRPAGPSWAIEDDVLGFREHFHHQHTHGRFVIDHKNSLAMSRSTDRGRFRRADLVRLSGKRAHCRQSAAGQADPHDVVVEGRHLRPTFPNLAPQQPRMSGSGESGIGVVVDHHPVGPPQQDDGKGGPSEKTDNALEALRPNLMAPSGVDGQTNEAMRDAISPEVKKPSAVEWLVNLGRN
jgi:hypothetical protein